MTMSISISSDGDGRLLNLTSDSSSFGSGEIVMMVGGESLGSSGGDDTMSA